MYDDDAIQKQRAEFDAVADLANAYKSITHTPIVDNDYPKVRHYYEGALHNLIKALKENNRIT